MFFSAPLAWRRLFGSAALICWCAAPAWCQGPNGAPNIVFILADDLGFGDTGVTGQNARKALNNPNVPYFETPNIDSIALQGARFDSVYAGQNTCAPSRAALLTGFDTGHVYVDRVDINPVRGGEADRTWAQMLQNAGYETGWFGKWHLSGAPLPGSSDALPGHKGFETGYGSMSGTFRSQWHYETTPSGGVQPVAVPADPTWTGPGGPYAYGEDLVANRAEQFIRQQSVAGQPFAAYVAFIEPHADVTMVPQDHAYVNKPWPKADRDYAGIIARLDAHVGQIRHALDDPNNDGDTSDSVADNTLLVFTSDNGPVWNDGTAGYAYEFFDSNSIYSGHKWLTQEGGVKVPFFVRWGDKIAPGTVNSTYAGAFEDIMPTFAELVGQDVPLGIDGRSMLPDLLGTSSGPRDSLMWSTERLVFGGNDPANYAIRVGDWKLVVRSPSTLPSVTPAAPLKLYNLAVDPSETNNLLNSRPDIVSALQSIIVAEGGLREATLPWFNFKPPTNPNNTPESVNSYFTQYKTWAPQSGSADFYAAGNWSGGTQYWMASTTPAATPVEAQNWNTGPADNWLATMNNTSGAMQEITLNSNADVLAIELRGTSTMRLHVAAGAKLSARNGLRVSSGGDLRLHGGEINTIRDLEIRPGGQLLGEGLINGQQSVLAEIPEFASLRLFEPRLINRGTVSVHAESLEAGRLLVQGDYTQESDGKLQLDMFTDGVAGLDFDQLAVTGDVTLGGALEVSAPNVLLFEPGNVFEIMTIGGVRSGVFSSLLAPELPGDLSWALQYNSNAVLLGVVQGAGSGGPFDYLTRFNQSFGIDGGADLDGDNDTDGFDFLTWQRGAFTAESVPVGSAVPEPGSVAMVALVAALGLPLLRRRGCGGSTTRR